MSYRRYTVMHSALLVLPLASAAALNSTLVEVKDIAAPPADITSGRVRLPDPATCATSSWTALLPAGEVSRLERGTGKAIVALLAEDAAAWSLSLDTGAGTPVVMSQLQDAGPLLRGSLARVAIVEPDVKRAEVLIEAPRKDARGWVLLADGCDEVRLESYFGSHAFLVGAPVLLHTRVHGARILEGNVHLRSPGGAEATTKLELGKGTNGTALLEFDRPGDWTIRTVVRVLDVNGIERVRTTQQYVRAERPEVSLAGEVLLEQADDGRVELTIPVSVLAAEEIMHSRRVAVGCEIWGVDAAGREVPVCWAARMQELAPAGGAAVLGLRFDPRWIALAQVDPGSISLRELRIQGAESFVPFVHEPSPVSEVLEEIASAPKPIKPVRGMLAARSGHAVEGIESNSMLSHAGHVMVISHGYCTDIFPWTTEDFSGDMELFLDLDQNLSHDEFALRYEAFGRNFKSMGITGHSQSGNAAAHLYTFYWSSLDWASGERKIQGVGVPWLGSALASNVALLGEIFGIGCGPNFDMTYDGSALWISWIPTWVREETWYWTTSFQDDPFWYDYCQILSDVLLTDPDDGVVEQWAGQLDGGNNGGHKEDWCHTRLMRDPPQCTDGTRNAELNSESAR